jgi:hypothetical protein
MGIRQDWHERDGKGFRRTPDDGLDDEERAAAQMERITRLVPRYKPLPPPGFEPSRPPRTSAVLRLLRSVRRLFLG